MRLIRGLFKIIKGIILFVLACFAIICIWHNAMSIYEDKQMMRPGDKIEVYENKYIHAVKMGSGDYTVVFLPGMGTASPYYDYYNLANKVAENNQVIIIEPYGYGFSDDISEKRSLKNYEYELSEVLKYYNVSNNIIILNHSYSGLSSLDYANKHSEVKGIVCLDCTTAYQIEAHVKDGKLEEGEPKTSKWYSALSILGISRFGYTFFMDDVLNELLEDVPVEYHDNYKYFLYTKTLNETIINEMNDISQNEFDLLYHKYNDELHVTTILSDKTIESMKINKNEGYFYKDWEEMHGLLISNPDIQKIYVLEGNHYIHHGHVDEISTKLEEMINDIKKP